jgi:hypothetical protein
MIVTLLASLFLIMLVGVIFYGYGFVMKSTNKQGAENARYCMICNTPHEKGQLVERVIGDSRVVYFCKRCITRLAEESAPL